MGIVIAIVVGLLIGGNWYTDTNNYAALVLALLGFLVGVLSFFAVGTITKDEVPTFLIAALMLVGIGTASTLLTNIAIIGNFLKWISAMIAAFIIPAAILLAIRAIWDIGKSAEPARK
ncbi:MAG: hypothetical protein QHH19_01655 [Candidatus Thermoplasmatota archaeon]|nr:hypothetical protein [Candidatus Thermoplasmatota archaeon]